LPNTWSVRILLVASRSATDRAAVDGIWAARDLGVTVPDQLAVIGIGNIPEG
jgi:hypothetical protein